MCYSILFDIFKKYVPKSRIYKSAKIPWSNKELRNLRNRKNVLWNSYIKTKSIADHLNFVNCFEKYPLLYSKLYNEYKNKVQQDIFSDSRAFFKFINNKKQSDELQCA